VSKRLELLILCAAATPLVEILHAHWPQLCAIIRALL
jgi:hypothetical protein